MEMAREAPESLTESKECVLGTSTLESKIDALMEVCRLRGIAYAQSLMKSTLMGYDLEAQKLKEDIVREYG